MTNFETFLHHYIVAALWSSTDENDTPLDSNYDSDDLAPETLAAMTADCEKFFSANLHMITDKRAPMAEYWDGSNETKRRLAMAAHDFWLTRCGHGAGFWDGDWPEPLGERLTASAEAFGNVDLYVGDDGKIWA